MRSTQAHSGLWCPELAQLRPQIVPWSTLYRADWVRNDPVLTTRGWLLTNRAQFLRELQHQGSMYDGWAWAREGDCGSTSPRSLDELIQLRIHIAYYLPAFVDQFIARGLQD